MQGFWAAGMSQAYTNGLEDGRARKPFRLHMGYGFDAAYREGYKHGSIVAEKNGG